jgi:hypothetical protein
MFRETVAVYFENFKKHYKYAMWAKYERYLGDAVLTGRRGYGRLACRHCGSTGHLRKFSASEKEMLAIGVGYSGRATLRREQCDVQAVE